MEKLHRITMRILIVGCFVVAGVNAYMGFVYGGWYNWLASGFVLVVGLVTLFCMRRYIK